MAGSADASAVPAAIATHDQRLRVFVSSTLTELAERAFMTKQSVGEVVSDLQGLDYVERVPDPADGRAKIIRLTERGHAAQALGFALIDDLEREWAERYGEQRIAGLRDALEAVSAQRLGLITA